MPGCPPTTSVCFGIFRSVETSLQHVTRTDIPSATAASRRLSQFGVILGMNHVGTPAGWIGTTAAYLEHASWGKGEDSGDLPHVWCEITGVSSSFVSGDLKILNPTIGFWYAKSWVSALAAGSQGGSFEEFGSCSSEDCTTPWLPMTLPGYWIHPARVLVVCWIASLLLVCC